MRDRHLGRFLAGNLVSSIGTFMHNIAAAIVVFEITGSAFMVGLLAAAQFGPTLVLAPWAGMTADRTDLRRLLMVTQLVSGTAGAALAAWIGVAGVAGLPGAWPLIATSGVIGVAFAFSIPTHQALVASLVPPRDLEGALALNTVTFNLARAVGPALAGVAVATVGPAVTFGINALTFAAFALALSLIEMHHGSKPSREPGSIRDGVKFLSTDPMLAFLLLGIASLGFASDPVNTLAPAVAAQLGGGEVLVGMLVTSFGVGAVLGAVTVARARRRVARRPLGIGGLALLGGGMAVLAVSPNVAVAVTGLAVAGFGFLFAVTILTADIYSRIPEAIRGRVLALWGVAFLGSRPLAGLVDGALADLVSTRVAVGFAASTAIAAALILSRRWQPTERDDHRQKEALCGEEES